MPPIVAVRSSGLMLDSIIGFQSTDRTSSGSRVIVPMVSEDYLRTLLRLVNSRFRTNEERKARFLDHFVIQISAFASKPIDTHAKTDGWETRAARSARQRTEGLARREESLLFGGSVDGTERDDGDDDDEDFGLGVFEEEAGNDNRQVGDLDRDDDHG